MSDQQPVADPSRVETVMTNHIAQPANTEHINGGSVVSKAGVALLVRQDSSETIDAKPKSTFKITSVTLHPQKGSSQDGRHSFGDGEDDEESAVEDSLVHTDVEESPGAANHLVDVLKQGQRQDRVDSTSRFKVVKIQKREPYTVGRWRISDFMSESEVSTNKIVGEVNQGKRSDSGNSSRASSTHYVHGVDDPAKNPLANVNASSSTPLASIQQSPLTPSALSANVESAAEPHSSAAKADHVGESNASTAGKVEGDNVQSTTSKDPHLIGQQPPLPTNPPSNTSDIVRAAAVSAAASVAAVTPTAQITGTNTNQQHTMSRDQTTPAAAQANTQTVLQQAAPTTPNTPQAAQAASTVTVPTSAAAGGSSDSQSSSADPNHKPTTEEVPAATSVQPKPQTSSLVENLEISGGVEALAANLTGLVDPSAADGDKAEDADATATGVAIDNKIEQAMDLVKSHLMLAVREEVEDLKLQIKQLIERNSQLEQENKLLRSSAAPETMAQLALLNRQQNH